MKLDISLSIFYFLEAYFSALSLFKKGFVKTVPDILKDISFTCKVLNP